MGPGVDYNIRDLYEACMIKDYKMRPSASQLLSLDFIQRWCKELNMNNHQTLRYSRGTIPITKFLKPIAVPEMSITENLHIPQFSRIRITSPSQTMRSI